MRAEKKQMEWVGDVNYRILAIYDGNVLRWNIVYEIQIDATKKHSSTAYGNNGSMPKYDHSIKKGKRGSAHTTNPQQ